MRPMPPFASAIPEVPKSLNQRDELRRVGAEEREAREAVLKRADRLAEGALGEVVVGGRRGSRCWGSCRSPASRSRPRPWPGARRRGSARRGRFGRRGLRIVFCRSVIVGTASWAARRKVVKEGPELVGDRLRGVDERGQVVERRAQVDEGGVRLAHEVGQLDQRLLRARLTARPAPPSSGSRCGPEARCRRRAGPALRTGARCRRSGSRSAGVSRVSSPKTCREVDRNGFRYL